MGYSSKSTSQKSIIQQWYSKFNVQTRGSTTESRLNYYAICAMICPLFYTTNPTWYVWCMSCAEHVSLIGICITDFSPQVQLCNAEWLLGLKARSWGGGKIVAYSTVCFCLTYWLPRTLKKNINFAISEILKINYNSQQPHNVLRSQAHWLNDHPPSLSI
jgi:hypothetical protein